MSSSRDRAERRSSHPEQIGKRCDDRNDRKCEPHACQSICRHMRNMPDIDPVHDAVKHIDELCQCHRKGKAQDIPGNTSLAEIILGIASIIRRGTSSLRQVRLITHSSFPLFFRKKNTHPCIMFVYSFLILILCFTLAERD